MMQVTETINHGDYHYRSLPQEVSSASDMAAMLQASPYARTHQFGDATLLQMVDDLASTGHAYFGWSDFDVMGDEK